MRHSVSVSPPWLNAASSKKGSFGSIHLEKTVNTSSIVPRGSTASRSNGII